MSAAHKVVAAIVPSYPQNGVSAGDISTAYRFLGENDKALEWYVRALDSKDNAMLQMPYMGKGPREVFRSAAWQKLRDRPDVKTFERARERIAAEFTPRNNGT
jgi:hypothetical protein